MYTVGDIQAAVDEDFDGDWSEFLYLTEDDEGAELPSLKTIAKYVDEGGEKRPWVIFKVGEQYFEKNGVHDSWEGTEWDGGFQEVEPFEKTITAYRAKG